jgi:hypothetical protein
VSQKGHPLFILVYCHFLLLLQKKVTKEKESGNDNFSLFWQNALGLTLPKKAEVRAISGLPSLLQNA